MSGKLKFLLSILALGAFVSLSYVFSSFGVSTSPTTRSASILGIPLGDACQNDTDHDGLTDCEETYWNTDFKNSDSDGDGFLDGEEVMGGHNPAKKGPEDFLDKRGNVTQQAATLMLGAVAVGDLTPGSPTYNSSIESLTDAVIERYKANSQVPEQEVTTGTDSHSDAIKYGFASSNLIGPTLSNLAAGFASVVATITDVELDDLGGLSKSNPNQYKIFIAEIDRQITALSTSLAAFKKMTVPPSMVVGHKNILTLLAGTQQQYRLLRQIAQDPVQGIFAYQSLANLTHLTVLDVIEDFTRRLNNALQR